MVSVQCLNRAKNDDSSRSSLMDSAVRKVMNYQFLTDDRRKPTKTIIEPEFIDQ